MQHNSVPPYDIKRVKREELMDTQTVKLSSLPSNILSRIPLSIRSYKDEYLLSELPFNIQYLIEDYREDVKDVEYDIFYDFIPELSQSGDFSPIEKKSDLVLEYFKNYLGINYSSYPFDCEFGNKLKKYLHVNDTMTKSKFLNLEIYNLADNIARDLNINVVVDNIDYYKTSDNGIYSEYTFKITLKLDEKFKTLSFIL